MSETNKTATTFTNRTFVRYSTNTKNWDIILNTLILDDKMDRKEHNIPAEFNDLFQLAH